jgi:hypothetical protein
MRMFSIGSCPPKRQYYSVFTNIREHPELP